MTAQRTPPRDPRVAALIQSARREAWDLDTDLPWHIEVDREQAGIPVGNSLLAETDAVRAMSAEEQQRLAFAEACFHLSNLLAGEQCGERLGAEVIAVTTEHRPEDREFLALLVQEETRHAAALKRYLANKVDTLYEPEPRLVGAIAAVSECPWLEIKLLAGQGIFEWTAASLISTLLVRAEEPLIRQILMLNLRDESRHLAFARQVSEPLRRMVGSRKATESMSDVLFEAIAGSLAALFAQPVWDQFGLATRETREHVFLKLETAGVIHRYQKLLLRQIERFGFPVDGLELKLERNLKDYLTR